MTSMNKRVPFSLFNDIGELDFNRHICGMIDLLVAVTSGRSPPVDLF